MCQETQITPEYPINDGINANDIEGGREEEAADRPRSRRLKVPFEKTPDPIIEDGLPTTVLNDSIPELLDEGYENEMLSFLRTELDLHRLDKVHNMLWFAGRPQSARPLHRQVMMGRTPIVTEQFDLHLVWRGSQLFLKPLPAYLLNKSFWESYLLQDQTLHGSACGFILSYIWLIRHPSDMQIARDRNLFPAMPWEDWRKFTKSFLRKVNPRTLQKVDRRFHHGELRASRLNIIYRFYPRVFNLPNFTRGYTYGYNQYGDWFKKNFLWLITVLAYNSVILSALQVALATAELSENALFNAVSSGFALFSIALPLAATFILFVLFTNIFVSDWTSTIKVQRQAWRIRHSNVTTKENPDIDDMA